jgi:hypothetical protein
VHAEEQAPDDAAADEQMKIRLKQGRAIFGVDMKIVDDNGEELPWDGKTYGDLYVKGPWIVREYFKGEGGDPLVPDAHGVAGSHRRRRDHRRRRLHADHRPQQGRDQVRRRVDQLDRHREHRDGAPGGADGGLRRHEAPEVGRAADRGGGEAAGHGVTREELLKFYEGKTPSGRCPTTWCSSTRSRSGATGKMLKTRLREQLKDYKRRCRAV